MIGSVTTFISRKDMAQNMKKQSYNRWKRKDEQIYSIPLSMNFLYNISFMKKLLNIDFKKDQGLILRWKCANLSKCCHFFRHIIVLLDFSPKKTQSAFEGKIRHMKLGDLYSVVYGSNGTLRKKEWNEKTSRDQERDLAYLKQNVSCCLNLKQIFLLLQEQIKQFEEPIILNFVLQNQSKFANLEIIIKEKQAQQKVKFICTIFSSSLEDNHVSISKGINCFSLKEPFVFQFYHNYINQMALEYAHLVITCCNGEINSYDKNIWRNISFNKIQRKYYGPNIRYLKDVLHFINTKAVNQGIYNLDFLLTFKSFSGTTYTADKKISINFDYTEMYNRTACFRKKSRIYYSTEDLVIEENPYESETVICFEKSNEMGKQEKNHNYS